MRALASVGRLSFAVLLACIGHTSAGAAARDKGPAPIVIRVDPQASPPRPGRGPRSPGPVTTLDEALDLVAAIRVQHPGQPITVALSPGLHRLDHAVRIGSQQGGTSEAPLVIKGAPGGASHLTGSVELTPVALPLPPFVAGQLPPAARTHVKLYRLPPATLVQPRIQAPRLLQSPHPLIALEVYDAQGALAPARWPNQGWARTGAGTQDKADPGFTLDDARLEAWRKEPDLWAEGFWRWNWLMEALPVVGVQVDNRRVDLAQLPYEGIAPGMRFRISHALSELDQPGEWWRDEADGLLVAWPRGTDGRLEVAVSDGLLNLDHVGHVRLDDLTFEHARGDLVTVQGGSDVMIRHSAFHWTAGRAIVFEGAEQGGVESCSFSGIGDVAVRLNGGDRATLRPGGLFVRGSRFTDYARLALSQSPAVQVDGVGATVSGNLFHDAATAAIWLHGNDHHVAGNEITRLLAGLTDNGVIYAGRDWTARGSVIEHNYLHDIHPEPGFEDKGVYLDDEASGFTVRDNLFVRVDQAVFVGGGRDNRVTGNVFVASSPAIHVDSRGQTWAAKAISDPDSELRRAFAAMPVDSPLWQARYPGLAGILADEPAIGKRNLLRDNVFVLSRPFEFNDGGEKAEQIVYGNKGPDGIRTASGPDLAKLAARGRTPHDFAHLLGPDGRPIHLPVTVGAKPAP